MRVVCCTMLSPSHQELADISIPNLEKYCKRHGYDMHIINIENDKWEYRKHETFVELFDRGYDLIWYKDIDSIITNMGIEITSFIDDRYSLFITKDFTELNGGSIIIKNNNEGNWVNNNILELKGTLENEQNAICQLYQTPFFYKYIKVLPHPSINSYDYSCYPECKDYIGREDLGDWHPGNFVIHFPALQLKDRVELMKEYSQKIIE